MCSLFDKEAERPCRYSKLFSLVTHSQPEGEATALVWGGLYRDAALHLGGNHLADAQAKARALPKLIDLVETVEDHQLLFGCEADAAVFYVELYLSLLMMRLSAKVDVTLGCEFGCVGQEVGQYLFDSPLVGTDGQACLTTYHFKD